MISFEGFIGRKERLAAIPRYHVYSPMFYRSSVYDHAVRVHYLLKEALPIVQTAFEDFDTRRSLALALVHDDWEIVMGDFQAGNKALLSPDQIQDLHAQEIAAIDNIAKQFPEHLGTYRYASLLIEAFETETIESQVVKYLDRFDALGEAMHELFAGNHRFANPVTTAYGTLELPASFYLKRFNQNQRYYPLLGKLLRLNKLPFMESFPTIDERLIAKQGKPHTETSLLIPKGHPAYDWWIATLIKHLNAEQIRELYEQKEH